jgi:hypothetical protein
MPASSRKSNVKAKNDALTCQKLNRLSFNICPHPVLLAFLISIETIAYVFTCFKKDKMTAISAKVNRFTSLLITQLIYEPVQQKI